MRAVALPGEGAAPEPTLLPVPAPSPGEILVRVRASSINPIDVRIATGRYPWAEYVYPAVPGFDFAGAVAARGEGAERFALGDEVLGYSTKRVFGAGTWAEYYALAEDGLVEPKPAALDFAPAAALPLAATTAAMLVDGLGPIAGEEVLIVGAGGAIGAYAVQLAAAVGARVIATARRGDASRLAALGAAETIDYTAGDIVAPLREAHPAGLAALIDLPHERRSEVTRLAALVRDGGRVGSACAAADPAALGERGIGADNVVATDCDRAVLGRVVELVGAGELAVGFDDVRPLEEVPAALAALAAGNSAKVVVEIAAEGE